MKTGEKYTYIVIAVLVIVMLGYRGYQEITNPDPGIPFYTTAAPELKQEAELIYKKYECSDCHALWMVRNMMQNVPAPALDGIGSLKDEAWFYDYLSAEDPQAILPSRLKDEFKMPSYASIPERERRILAAYLASLKVEDWYLEEVKKSEYEKLTGKQYRAQGNEQAR